MRNDIGVPWEKNLWFNLLSFSQQKEKHSYHSNEKDNYLHGNDEDISGVASRRRPEVSRKKNNDETKSGAFELPDRAEVAVHVGGQVAGVLLHQLPQNHLCFDLKKKQIMYM